MEALLDLTHYTRYGDAGLGGTTPAWMTAHGRQVIAASGVPEPHAQTVLAQLAAGSITRAQATTRLAA